MGRKLTEAELLELFPAMREALAESNREERRKLLRVLRRQAAAGQRELHEGRRPPSEDDMSLDDLLTDFDTWAE